MRSHVIKLNGLILFLAAGLIISSAAHAAGLIEVKQTVFGMDCAPCAHGVEKGLEKLEGVKDVTVSLNKGYAAVSLTPDNAITLGKIQQVVRENGFTPKDATVVISGTVAHSTDHQLLLATGANQKYILSAASDKQSAWQKLQALPIGTTVEVKAHLSEGETRKLSVLEIEPQI